MSMEDLFYRIKVNKNWFRGKDVFTQRLNTYAKEVAKTGSVRLPLNAGNMIYVLLRRLELGVEWDRQDALIASYRDLMYRLSYVDMDWTYDDINFVHMSGQKSDVLWALSFVTQVFPEAPMECMTFEYGDGIKQSRFLVDNGCIDGETQASIIGESLPDIWSNDANVYSEDALAEVGMAYDPRHEPDSGERFALPDGRCADYVRMDERYYYAEKFGRGVDTTIRHNITASLIKDVEDVIYRQTAMPYETYQMRYIALMNKVHELEKLLHGLEISAYDVLPVCERGLPYASQQTVDRTNMMDCNSIKYIIDKVKRNKNRLSNKECKEIGKDAAKSVIARINGYETEYRTYQKTGTPEALCRAMHDDSCFELYADVAELESYSIVKFPPMMYAALCHDPVNMYQMTAWERNRLRAFGRGYFDFVVFQLDNLTNKRQRRIYEKAFANIEKRYG